MSDGPSIEIARESVHSAIAEWIEEARRLGREIPDPQAAAVRSAMVA